MTAEESLAGSSIMTVDLKAPDGSTEGSIELPAEIFDAQANIALMHQVVIAQLAAARQGTHDTKTRGEVRGGGRKPYRQKGTGRARQGSTRAPQFTGGGVVHGPTPRDYSQRTPKKMKAAALRGALSDRARAGQVHVVTGLVDGDTPSTKTARKVLEAVSSAKRLLLVLNKDEEINWLSARNLPNVHLIDPGQLNTYDVLVNDDVVFTKDALDAFLAGPKGGATAVAVVAAPAEKAEKAKPAKETQETKDAKPAKETKAKAEPKEAEQAEETQAEAKGEDAETVDFGPGSHAPLEDGSEPEGYPIKGNLSSKLYHVPGSSHYNRTTAEVWFATEEDAEQAGFQLPPSQRKAKEDKE
jgi:large subunit ribosomal protein L4